MILALSKTADSDDQQSKVSAFITLLVKSKRCPWLLVELGGRNFRPRSRAAMPIGTLIANSHCQEATDKMPAAIVGPAADETATISALIPTPRPRKRCG